MNRVTRRLRRCLANLADKLIAENVFTLVSYILRMNRYILLLPFTHTPDRRFVLIPGYYVFCAVVLITGNCAVLVETFSRLSTDDIRNPYSLLSFSRLLANVMYIFLLTAHVQWKSSKWLTMLNTMVKWDTLHPLSKDLMTAFTITTILQFMYFFVCAALFLYSIIVLVEDPATFRFYSLIIFSLITIYTEGLYTIIICNLGWLNACFDGMYKEIRERLAPDDAEKANIDVWEIPNSVYRVRRRKKVLHVDDITALRYSYGRLLDIKNTINDQYAPDIFLTITSIFFDLVFFVFFLISVFQFWDYMEADVNLVKKFRLIALKTTSQITKLIFTICLCERMKKKERTPASDLYKSILTVSHPEAKNELLIFSVELLQRTTEISAAGFFTVDFVLLHTIIASVTVYAIMLIQFDFPMPKHGDNPIESLCKFI